MSVLSNQLAVLDIDLPFDISQQLGLRTVNDRRHEPKTPFRVWFSPGGVRGGLSGNVCGSAVFPAGRVCTDGASQERALDASSQATLDKISGLGELPVDWAEGASVGELPVEWADRTSTIHVTLEDQPQAVCTGFFDAEPAPYTARISLHAHVQSTDGRIDLHLPGQLDVREPYGDRKGSWDLRFVLTLPAAALAAPATLDFPRGMDDLVDFYLGVSGRVGQPPNAGLVVRAVRPAPGVEQPTAIVGSGSGTGVQCFGVP